MSKAKKKGDQQAELDLEDMKPWVSLNVAFNFNTCLKSAVKLNKQITKHAENEEYITIITRELIIESAKDNMLYVDLENISDKQKKEKGATELPKVLTPEILAKATMFLIKEQDETH